MTTALYGGSFDPVHNGHLCIIAKASALFDEVVVGVLGNSTKGHGLFDVADRVRLIDASVADFGNVRAYEGAGLTVDLATEVEADVLVRSAHKEHGIELPMADMNRRIGGMETVLIYPDAAVASISSSAIRHLVAEKHLSGIEALVPAAVASALRSR